MTYTQEPWQTWDALANSDIGIVHVEDNGDLSLIAEVYEVVNQSGRKADVEANARLIAASPVMFILLNEWLDTPFFETKEEWQEWLDDYRPRVEQALAQVGKEINNVITSSE